MLQFRKPEERRWLGTQRQLDGAVAFFDLVLGKLLSHLLAIEVRMRPGMGADCVSGRSHLLEYFGMVGGVLADRKKHSLGAFVRKRLQHRGRIARPRTVVECQHDFLVGKENELLEKQKAEYGPIGS